MHPGLQPRVARDDPLVYFTLIDFLTQIIFFGIFALIIFQSGARKEVAPEKLPAQSTHPVYYLNLRDLQPSITADQVQEVRELLSRLQEKGAMERLLKFLQQRPDAFALIRQCLDHPQECEKFSTLSTADIGKLLGVGKPPCLTEADRLFAVDAYSDRLVVTEIYEKERHVLTENNVSLTVDEVIPKSEIVSRLSGLNKATCRHYIQYMRRDDSEDMRHVVEQVVRPNIIRPRGSE
jgi:hypothetical protein